MQLKVSDNDAISILISRITEAFGFHPAIFLRDLEPGPAADLGISAYLVTVDHDTSLVLFSARTPPGDQEIDDLLAHTLSADADAAILVSSEYEKCWFSPPHEDESGTLTTLRSLISSESSDSCITVLPDTPDITRSVVGYLREIRKELSGWLYRQHGETGLSRREIIIQTLMNQVLISRLFLTHHQQITLSGSSLRDDFLNQAGSFQAWDQYDPVLPPHDDATSELVKRLATSLPSPPDIRLSWISAAQWADIFSQYLALIPKKGTKKLRVLPDESGTRVRASRTNAGRAIVRALREDVSTLTPKPFCDPSAGCGEMIILVLNLLRESSRKTQTDSLIGRLSLAADTVHAADRSPVRTAIIRCVVMIWILGGDLRDPALTHPSSSYPLSVLMGRIRTGSLLFGEDLADEFVSSTTEFQTLRHLHPLSPRDLRGDDTPFFLVISSPDEVFPGTLQQTGSYLTRRYRSYHTGAGLGALLLERGAELIRPGGACIIFIRAAWLSEDGYRGMRRWIVRSLPATIIIPVLDSGDPDHQDISAIISRNGVRKDLEIVRISNRRRTDPPLISTSTLRGDDLPEDHGWRLEDPRENQLWDTLHKGAIPLDEYVFHELYPGPPERTIDTYNVGWISLHERERDLMVTHGTHPDSDALGVIPGHDLFLLGVLHSAWIRWCWQYSSRTEKRGADFMARIRTLPIPSADPYDEEDERARLMIEAAIRRIILLTRKRDQCRASHDHDRVYRQLQAEYHDLNQATGRLYRVTPESEGVVNRKVPTTDDQTAGFHIF